MSSHRHRIVRRRIGAAVCGLLGFWIAASAVGSHVDGVRTRHIEYMQNIPVFVIISAVLIVIGGCLLFASWRLWRVPEQLP
jgi:hypothetical protein